MNIEEEIVSGVGALIVMPEDLSRGFLTIEERRSKRLSGKLIGMRSLPMETIEVGETHQQALERLLFRPEGGEELTLSNVNDGFDLTKKKLGRYELNKGVVLHAYVIETSRDMVATLGSEKDEVSDLQWTPFDDVMQNSIGSLRFRPGVYEVVSDYLEYIKNPVEYGSKDHVQGYLRNEVPTLIFDLTEQGAILAEDVYLFVIGQRQNLPGYDFLSR